MMNSSEFMQVLLDYVASGQVGARDILMSVSAAGLASGLSAATVQQALTAGETQTLNQAKAKRAYDYIVIGSGASGSIIAGELSKTGADVLVVESGGEDADTTISNPSIWFYNVGGPLDWTLPIAPVPQLNNGQFNMALGRVLGGGSSVNAMVWTRGTERDYDTWEGHGATGWAFKDVLPTFKAQEDWEGGANDWRGVGGPVHVRTPGDPHPTAPAFLEAARQMGFPIIDDMNGPMRAGIGYINMNIAADGSRVLLNTHATRVLFDGDRASGVEIVSGEVARTVEATREVILAADTIHSTKLLMLSGVGDATDWSRRGHREDRYRRRRCSGQQSSGLRAARTARGRRFSHAAHYFGPGDQRIVIHDRRPRRRPDQGRDLITSATQLVCRQPSIGRNQMKIFRRKSRNRESGQPGASEETIVTSREPELSRRRALSGLAAAVAGSGLTKLAWAAQPMVNVQVPPAYRFRLGGFECTVVSDGPLKLGEFTAEMFKGISQERIDEILAAHFLDKTDFTVDQNALVVNTGGKLVLIDTGMGFRKIYGPRTGHLLANLRSVGIDPASIDVVAVSHAHPDHVWGLVNEEGKPNFPNAQIYITQADLEYWTDEAKLSDPALGHYIGPIRDALLPWRDRIVFLKDGQDVVPGLQALSTPGHTVGHTSFVISSQGHSIVYLADLGHSPPLQMQYPRAEFARDTDPKQGATTRLRTFDMVASGKIPIVAYHFPWPGIGHVAKTGDHYRYVAIEMQTVL